MNLLSASILITLLVALQAVAADSGEVSKRDLPAFREVAGGLYRAGQPTPKGFALLKRRGIKTVINLRAEDDEQTVVRDLGMKYVHIPLSAWHRVPDEAIQTFFAVLRDKENYPVMVLCERGADQTGVMVGLYRIAFQGWSADRAYEEARSLGMRWWYRSPRNQLYDFARKRRAVEAPIRGE